MKQLVARDLQLPAGLAQLDHEIRSNAVPLFDVATKVARASNRPESAFHCYMTNIGSVCAFNVKVRWKNLFDGSEHVTPMVGAQRHIGQTVQAARGMGTAKNFKDVLFLTYQTPAGHFVKDVFQINFTYVGSAINAGATLLSREFEVAPFGNRPYTIATPPPSAAR